MSTQWVHTLYTPGYAMYTPEILTSTCLPVTLRPCRVRAPSHGFCSGQAGRLSLVVSARWSACDQRKHFPSTGTWHLQKGVRSVLASSNSAEAEVEGFPAATRTTDAFKRIEAKVSAVPNPSAHQRTGSAMFCDVRLPSHHCTLANSFQRTVWYMKM
jgi:hypothetical protein